MSRNPERALDLITRARGNEPRLRTAEWILPELAKVNPARAVEYLQSNALLTRHSRIYAMVASVFRRTSPQEAIAWAESLPNARLRSETVNQTWMGWATADPQAAAAALSAAPGKKLGQDVYDWVSRTWSKTDPAAALAWAESLGDDRLRASALRSVAFDLQTLGPEGARQLIASISSPEIRGEQAGRLGHEYAREDLDQARAWAESLPEESGRKGALHAVLQELAESDPEEATRYAAEIDDPEGSRERENVFRHALNRWAEADPEAAFEYGQGLPPGNGPRYGNGDGYQFSDRAGTEESDRVVPEY